MRYLYRQLDRFCLWIYSEISCFSKPVNYGILNKSHVLTLCDIYFIRHRNPTDHNILSLISRGLRFTSHRPYFKIFLSASWYSIIAMTHISENAWDTKVVQLRTPCWIGLPSRKFNDVNFRYQSRLVFQKFYCIFDWLNELPQCYMIQICLTNYLIHKYN